MVGQTISHYAPEAPACRLGRHPLNESIYDPVGLQLYELVNSWRSRRPVGDKILEKLGEVPIRLDLASGAKLSPIVGLSNPPIFGGSRR